VSTSLLEDYRAKYADVVEKELKLQKSRTVGKLLTGMALDKKESMVSNGVEKVF
jgi:hypothetical protein